MAIIKLFPEFLSNSSIQFAPKRTFTSSSYGGVTGSISIIVNRSKTQKDSVDEREGIADHEGPQKFDENTFEGRRKQIYEGKKTPVGSGEIFSESTSSYNYDLQLGLLLDGANPTDADEDGNYDDIRNFPPEYFKKQYVQLNLNWAHSGYSDLPMHPRNRATSSISRFVPGTDFIATPFRRKEIVRRVLDSSYAVGRPSLGWGYTNYSCLNMFQNTFNTGSELQPAVVYNSPSNRYLPTSEFQLEFYLKMQRQPTSAGTIIHLPGAFAVSVVTGSRQGNLEDSGLPLNYRLLLQLATQASGNVAPDSIDLKVQNRKRGSTTTYKSKGYITASYWHHCCVRYSPTQNNNTGSFLIDGRTAGYFEPPPSFTMANLTQAVDGMFVGAYYTGTADNGRRFFNNATRYRQGVENTAGIGFQGHPSGSFVSGLNAEVHEIKLSNKIRSVGFVRKYKDISTGSSGELLFHLPVLYTPDAPPNQYSAMVGDLDSTHDSRTNEATLEDFYATPPIGHRPASARAFPLGARLPFDSPFNTHHSNIGGFLNINAQAFLRDFATGQYPYLHNLSSSVKAYNSCHELSSSYGYQRFPGHKQRNLLVLPCDNGRFTQTYASYSTVDFSGSIISEDRPSVCDLSNLGNFRTNLDSKLCLVDEGWNYSNADSINAPHHGPRDRVSSLRPRSLGFRPPSIPSTKFFNPQSYGLIGSAEKSSNMIAVFNVPTLFYGNRINPGTVEMKSNLYVMPTVSGSDRLVPIRLIDDGYGNMVRADCSGSVAMNNFVGTVYYEDGIIALKSPHLFMMGRDHYEISFKGEQNLHMFEIMVPCSKTMLNSSSNPNYAAYAPSDRPNEDATDFVYLSGVNFHDSNMNVIAKARFSQPITKRKEDEFLIRVKFDF